MYLCQTRTVTEQSRFIPLSDLSEILSISASQAYALVRRGDLRAIKIGGRGQWRIERSELEAYISRMYDESARFIAEHPFVEEAALD
jgi:excisionase family DNA binding protein